VSYQQKAPSFALPHPRSSLVNVHPAAASAQVNLATRCDMKATPEPAMGFPGAGGCCRWPQSPYP
jgi:hypothetical protein